MTGPAKDGRRYLPYAFTDQGAYDFTATFTQPGGLDRNPSISCEAHLVRRDGTGKHNFINGYDSSDNHLFSVRLNGDQGDDLNEVAYTTGAGWTDLSEGLIFSFGSFSATALRTIQIDLTASSWGVWFDADGNGDQDGGEDATGLQIYHRR